MLSIVFKKPLLILCGILALGLSVQTARISWIKAQHSAELSRQETSLTEQFRKNQTITNEVSNAFQNSLSSLSDRLAALRMRGAGECMPVSVAPSGRDGSSGAGHAGAHGVDPATLYDYAGEAERYRLQLIACQDFVLRASGFE